MNLLNIDQICQISGGTLEDKLTSCYAQEAMLRRGLIALGATVFTGAGAALGSNAGLGGTVVGGAAGLVWGLCISAVVSFALAPALAFPCYVDAYFNG